MTTDLPRTEPSDGRSSERAVDGVGVASGIAIGPAYIYARRQLKVERRELSEEDIAAEADRFERAVERAERDLQKIASIAREKLGDESAAVFEAQALMLRDGAVHGAILDLIRRERQNADYAVQSVMGKHRRLMKASDSEYLRARADDLLDVQDRLIRHLRRVKFLSAIDPETIVVAESLSAADVVLFSRRHILGCALDYGGATSHVSIMARALGVPAVVGLHQISQTIDEGDMVIVDGTHGRVIVRPKPETVAAYREQQERQRQLVEERQELVDLPAVTQDGVEVALRGNLEFADELPLLQQHGASGIGLFRTEILFLLRGRLSISEDEQYETYRQILTEAAPHPTTIRLLDLGGDKMLPVGHREQNPFLGWRGIRVLLARPDLLKTQLRALLRASAHGSLRILVPMITNVSEMVRTRALLADAREELQADGVAHAEHIDLGAMVEVPAAVLLADRLAEHVDFFSIGTNDLTQYTLAVDRGNDLVADTYAELHPAVLQLIRQVVEAGQRAGIPVSVCGEMASKPRATPVLVGLGIRELSATPSYLPEVKQLIRLMRLEDAERLARHALAAPGPAEVDRLVDEWLRCHACDLAPLILDDPASVPSLS